MEIQKLLSFVVVIRISKIHDLKAIHNKRMMNISLVSVVIRISKIHDLKAIHNYHFKPSPGPRVVIRISKIHDLKAIHNLIPLQILSVLLLSEYQRYMI